MLNYLFCKFIFPLTMLFGGASTLLFAADTKLIINMDNIKELPSNYRPTLADYKHRGSKPTRQGLARMCASGSGQYSDLGLKALLRAIPTSHVILVDLREESHGFVDGIAVSWHGKGNSANKGKTPQQIEKKQQTLLNKALQQGSTNLYHSASSSNSSEVFVRSVKSEKEVAADYNVDYKRFYVTDHERPSDAMVDEFVTFALNLPKDAWLHFHCLAGLGRTTTFLAMYDMMLNHREVICDDIIKRQWMIGGEDLRSGLSDKSRKKRYAFITQFYEYCRANPTFERKWSEWAHRISK